VPAGAPPQVVDATREAFVSALSTGLLVGTGVVLISALLAWALVGRMRPTAAAEPVPQSPAPEALPVGEQGVPEAAR